MAERRGRGNALDAILVQGKRDRERLDAHALGPFSLTTLGIASVVGAGIFAITGSAAAENAGPAVVVSFVLAGIAAGLTALCYAELAALIPVAGSTYSYAYAAFGGFVAWVIGWDLLLEYLFAASTVAVSWAGYAVDLAARMGVAVPADLAQAPLGGQGVINLPAVLVVAVTTFLLVIGTRESARANNTMVLTKMAILVLFVIVGIAYVKTRNWEPFIPPSEGGFGDYGVSGVVRGAGVVFFAYVGFDAVSTAAAEARDPQRTVPIGLLGTVIISTVLYVAVGAVLTGMVDYRSLDVADPISKAVGAASPGLGWLRTMVDVAAVVGLASTVLVTFYGQTRILMRMSADGMLPGVFGRVSARFKTPQFTTIVCGIIGAIVAALLPITALAELVSIGTLLAFLLVCAGVLVLRRTHPELERPFRVPYVRLVAGLGIAASLALMLTLEPDTWIRLVVWLAIGLVIFLLYARGHSRRRFDELSREAG